MFPLQDKRKRGDMDVYLIAGSGKLIFRESENANDIV